eukprot:ANDGO_06635.mRNA.1 Serine/threonine-protein kinase fray2
MSSLEGVKSVFSSRHEDYGLLAAIGVGTNSEVWKAIYKPSSELVCVKIVDLEQYEKDIDEVRKEIMVMSSNMHPNIVTYHTSFVVGSELWLVMELLEGSCQDLIRVAFPDGLAEDEHEELAASILKQICCGLEYMHEHGLIHRDLKDSNILFDRKGRIRIGDFGVSAVLSESSGRKKGYTFVGTPCWTAPEVMEQQSGYDNKADIWSLGVFAYELATGHPPYHNETPMKVMLLVLQNPPPLLDDVETKHKISNNFKDFVRQCLVRDADKRSSASKLLQDCKFLRSVKNAEEKVKQFLDGETMIIQKVQSMWNSPLVRAEVEARRQARHAGKVYHKPGTVAVSHSADAHTSWDFGDDMQSNTPSVPASSNAGTGQKHAHFDIPSSQPANGDRCASAPPSTNISSGAAPAPAPAPAPSSSAASSASTTPLPPSSAFSATTTSTTATTIGHNPSSAAFSSASMIGGSTSTIGNGTITPASSSSAGTFNAATNASDLEPSKSSPPLNPVAAAPQSIPVLPANASSVQQKGRFKIQVVENSEDASHSSDSSFANSPGAQVFHAFPPTDGSQKSIQPASVSCTISPISSPTLSASSASSTAPQAPPVASFHPAAAPPATSTQPTASGSVTHPIPFSRTASSVDAMTARQASPPPPPQSPAVKGAAPRPEAPRELSLPDPKNAVIRENSANNVTGQSTPASASSLSGVKTDGKDTGEKKAARQFIVKEVVAEEHAIHTQSQSAVPAPENYKSEGKNSKILSQLLEKSEMQGKMLSQILLYISEHTDLEKKVRDLSNEVDNLKKENEELKARLMPKN